MTKRLRRGVAVFMAAWMSLSSGVQTLAAEQPAENAAAASEEISDSSENKQQPAQEISENLQETEEEKNADEDNSTSNLTEGGTVTEGQDPDQVLSESGTEIDNEKILTEEEPIDWSDQKEDFIFTFEKTEEDQNGNWTLSVQFNFPLKNAESTVKKEDTAFLELPVQWMQIEDTTEKEELIPFVEKEEDSKIIEEAAGESIAEYEIKDGTLEIVFTEGIESEEITSQITELKTRVEIPFIWKEGARTEKDQEIQWTLQTYEDNSKNETIIRIPALPEAEESEKTPETEEQEKSSEEDVEKKEEVKEIEEKEEAHASSNLKAELYASVGGYEISDQKYTGQSEERHIYWIDNNNGQLTRPAFSSDLSEADKNKLTFSAKFTYKDNKEEKTIELENLTWADISNGSSKIYMTDLGGTGHWVLKADGIMNSASLVINGIKYAGTFSDWTINTLNNKGLEDEKYVFVSVTGTNDDGIPVDQNNNLRPSAGERQGWFYVQKMQYESEIYVRTGTKQTFTDDELENLKKAILEKYSFFWKTGVKDASGDDLNAGSVELDSSTNWMKIQWNDEGEHLVGTVTVPDLEKYNLDGSELTFYIDGDGGSDVKITVPGMEEGDYLAESAVNDPVSNWGTNVTEVYNGGDLILTLTGLTEYEAYKEWHDKADPDHRPKVEFYLWRFTYKGEETDINTAYQTAAAVKATQGEHEGQTAQFTIQENSNEDRVLIDFSDNFIEEEGSTGYLPKYDPEGYRYVYISREYMSGESASRYRTEYGKLEGDAFSDTLPQGYDGVRVDPDNSIYNGGTVSNLLTGTTTASVTKTWVANAFQSELSDTIIELTLYSRVKGDESAEWEKTSTVYRMGEETKFMAEFLTQSHSITVNKYNNEGEELQFCWLETGVYQTNDPTKNLLDQGGSTLSRTFTLTQKEQKVKYTSTAKFEPNQDGTYSTEIVNRIEDKTQYYVEKQWDESIKEEDRKPISLRIYRTGIKDSRERLYVSENEKTDFTLDGKVDEKPTDLYFEGKKVGQVQETKSWFAEFTELEKYDADGSPYDYVVFESGNGGEDWTPQYSTYTDEDGRIIRVIKNVPGPEGETSILLRKRWLDDGDEQHRGTVTYTIYEIPEENVDNITPDVLKFEGVKIEEVTLSRADEWWKQVYLDSDVDVNRLLVLETSVASTDGNTANVTVQYSAENLQEIFAIQHDKSEEVPVVSYETTYHKYEASYSMVEFEGNMFYTVTNRRLGNIDIEVTKTWKDGSTDDQTSKKRTEFLDKINAAGYELVFQLVSNSEGAVVDYMKNTVTAGNEAVPIQDRDNNPARAIQVLNTEKNSTVYDFYNLPKYDQYGRLITYSVKEMLRKKGSSGAEEMEEISQVLSEQDIDTDYSFSMTQSGYEVEHGHQHDRQTFDAVNALSGSKEIFFWKEWNDAYRLKRNERPDLYLSLYQVKHEANGAEKAPESLYLDRRWQFKDDWISLCDFGSMPKYDEYGYEIIYYAQEQILINKEAFDYTDVYYKYSDQMETKDVLANGETTASENLNEHVDGLEKIGDEKVKVEGVNAPENVMIKNGSDVYLLKEYGIFVNELQADVHVSGKKIWANIPSGFLEEDLIPVTFRLYQFIDGNEPDDSVKQEEGSDGNYYLPGKDGKKSKEFASIQISDWKNQKYNGEYIFAIQYQGQNTNTVNSADGTITVEGKDGDLKIPKYDEDGNLYAYVLRESGDFSGTDAEKDTNLVFKQPTINNYAITNPYDSAKGKITVKKLLDTSNYDIADGKDPSVSFTLTRQYTQTGEAEDGTTSLVDDEMFSKTEIIKYSAFVNGEAELIFEDLEIYAPNGTKYVYTVTENIGESQLIQGGYQVYAGTGNLKEDSTDLKECQNGEYKVSGLYPKAEQSVGERLLSALRSLPKLLGITGADDEADMSYATFKNVYETYKVPLYFGKTWIDGCNEAGIRPKSLKFNVYRSANAQSGQGNPIAEKTLGSFEITLSDEQFASNSSVTLTAETGGLTVTNSNNLTVLSENLTAVTVTPRDGTALRTSTNWIIKVEFVEDFAPNGMPWIYGIQETDVLWPYTGTGKFTVNYVAPTGTETHGHFGSETSPASVTNSTNVTTTMWKNWRYDSAVNQKFKNPFKGYSIQIEASLYLGAVEIQNGDPEPGDADFNQAMWKKAEGSEYEDALKEYFKAHNTGNFQTVKIISYGATADLGVRDGASSTKFEYLPKVVSVNGKIYAMRYCIIETGFSLVSGSKTVYQETFTPHFEKLNKQPDTAKEKYSGNSRVGYWLEASAQILGNDGTLKDTPELLAMPRVDSKEDLKTVWEEDFYQVFDEGLDQSADPAVWPLVNYNTSDRESTAVNDIELTRLDVAKKWESDSDNIYGTREPNGSGNWKLTFQLQRSVNDPQNTEWKDVSGSTVTVSGKDEESSGKQSFTLLPVKILEQRSDGSYSVNEYKYRARETDNGEVVEDATTYRDAYKVSYVDGGDADSGYITNVTNTMETIELQATKNWEQDELKDKVTFELQYKKTDGSWSSFQTKAEVELDGTVDTNIDKKAYYEDAEWHAVWKGVPKVMTGSATTGEGENRQTVYRVVEVSENAYGSVTGNTLEGDGTKEHPYVLESPATYTDPFKITNELTRLKVEKIVEKYVNGAVVNDDFTFTITGDMNGITVRYQKYTKGSSGTDEPDGNLTTITSGGTFSLKDNQYVIFYGLKKGKTYTVQETESHGYTPEFVVTNADGSNGTVTMPSGNTKPTEDPIMTITNKYHGKLTVKKEDEKGEPLAGVTFKLQRNDGTSDNINWQDIDTLTTDAEGKVEFDKLELGKEYQITEESVPAGYNKLGEAVKIKLPYETDSKESGSTPLYTVNGKYYYADVTITIKNNKPLIMPTTSGTDFFWPGIAGLFVLAAGGGFYLYTGRRRRKKSS